METLARTLSSLGSNRTSRIIRKWLWTTSLRHQVWRHHYFKRHIYLRRRHNYFRHHNSLRRHLYLKRHIYFRRHLISGGAVSAYTYHLTFGVLHYVPWIIMGVLGHYLSAYSFGLSCQPPDRFRTNIHTIAPDNSCVMLVENW
jgi:hypothetical protein